MAFSGLYRLEAMRWTISHMGKFESEVGERVTRRTVKIKLKLPNIYHNHGRVQAMYMLPVVFNDLIPRVVMGTESFSELSKKTILRRVNKLLLDDQAAAK